MIIDGKLHEMITITFLKKNDPAEWKISVKILEFRDQINFVDAIAKLYYKLEKIFMSDFMRGALLT